MKIDFNGIIKSLEYKARGIYADNEKLKELLSSAVNLIEENQQLKEIVSDTKLMIYLVRDWIRGDYRNLSKNSIILIIIGLLYLVIPLDMIPDFLPMGFVDDIAVIGYIMSKISNEIKKYKEWKGIVGKKLISNKKFYVEEEEEKLDDDYFEL